MKKNNKKEIFLLVLIIFVAIFIRTYKLGYIPGGINQDEAMAAVDAKALSDYGTDRFGMSLPVHLTAWGYGQMSALLSYLMAIFIKIFGFNVIVIRIPTLIISILGLIFLYLFTKDVFNKKVAMIVLILGAINPWHIMQSRWALEANLFPHFFMAGLYFLNHFKLTKKRQFLILSMLIFGLTMYCYGISIYVVPLFLLMAAIYLFKKKYVFIKDILLAVCCYLIIAWPYILTILINFFKLKTITFFKFTIPYFPNSVRYKDILFFSDNILLQVCTNFKSLGRIIFQFNDFLWNNIPGFGTMYLFSIPIFIGGILLILKNKKDRDKNNLYLLFLLIAIITGILTNNVNVNRINIIFYPLLIANGVGIYYLISKFKFSKILLLILYSGVFLLFINTYFTSYKEEIGQIFYNDFSRALTYIKNYNVDYMYITSDSQYIGAYDVSEILTLFYHNIDAKYYQGIKKDKNGKFYNEKYYFDQICNISIDDNKNAVYLITVNDKDYFDNLKYKFKRFGNYYVVKRKKFDS